MVPPPPSALPQDHARSWGGPSSGASFVRCYTLRLVPAHPLTLPCGPILKLPPLSATPAKAYTNWAWGISAALGRLC